MSRMDCSALPARFCRCTVAGATRVIAATMLCAFAALPAAAQSSGPIKIGVLLPKSGPYAIQGENGYNGAQIAVADFGGKVLGRTIQLVWLDEASPQSTQQNMRKLVEEDKVVAVQGGVSSGDVLAIMPLALREKILLMATGPNATEITGKDCNRYTFRVDLPNRVTVRSTYPTLSKRGKNWYFVSASYAWGIDAYNQMQELLVKDGGKVLGFDQAPLGTTDYSSYVLKIRQAKPDVIFVGLGGTDLTNFLKQLHDVGLTDKVEISSPIVNDSDLWAAGPGIAFGLYPKLWNYTGAHNTAKSKTFAENYRKKFGAPPEVEGWQDWFGTTAILTAIKETGSTDSAKLVAFLEQHKFDGYKEMPIYFRPWDHQLLQPTLVANVKKKIDNKYDYFDIVGQYPQDEGKLDAFFGSKEDIGCKMGDLGPG
jgi:branched-chain amino acid transport system substrate-binding protein